MKKISDWATDNTTAVPNVLLMLLLNEKNETHQILVPKQYLHERYSNLLFVVVKELRLNGERYNCSNVVNRFNCNLASILNPLLVLLCLSSD